MATERVADGRGADPGELGELIAARISRRSEEVEVADLNSNRRTLERAMGIEPT